MKNRVFVVYAAGFALLALVAMASAGEPASQPAGATSADWPQFRGPTRDGIVPAGPKLLDGWPKEGPKLLWKSEPLWPDKGPAGFLCHAGCGSVSVAGGRAFIFASFRRNTGKEGKVVLSTKDLNALGWMEGVPSDLAKKVEEERIHGKGAKLPPGPELDAYAKEYVAGLDPELAKKFGPWIERRLKKETVPASFAPTRFSRLLQWDGSTTWNGDPAFEWSFLEKLAAVRDKEFSTLEEMDKQYGGLIGGYPGGSSLAIRVLLTNRSNSYFDAMICLDAATGNEIWRKEFPGSVNPYGQSGNIGGSSTPAISDDKCYVAGSAGMYCLSVKDGTVIWQAKAGFSHSSPLVMNGAVYCLVPEATAYDARTGQVLWRQPSLDHPNSSFMKWTSGGKDYLVVPIETAPRCISCLDPANGKTLWGIAPASYSSPVMAGPDTLVMECGAMRAYRITPNKAEMLWEQNKNCGARGASPVVFQGHIYKAGASHNGKSLFCFDVKTGEINWSQVISSGDASSPVLADGKIFALLDDGGDNVDHLLMVMYRATPEKYEELGRFHPDAGASASPAIVGGKLYLRLHNCIACYDLRADAK